LSPSQLQLHLAQATPDISDFESLPFGQEAAFDGPLPDRSLHSAVLPENDQTIVPQKHKALLHVTEADDNSDYLTEETDVIGHRSPDEQSLNFQSLDDYPTNKYQPAIRDAHDTSTSARLNDNANHNVNEYSSLLISDINTSPGDSHKHDRYGSVATLVPQRSHKSTIVDLSALYASAPLSKRRMIRVFELHSAEDPNDRTIRGSLHAIDLDKDVSFTALSYCWDEYSSPKDVIHCGDYSIEVTENCWSALWHMRKKFGSIKIWIDSICINQEDKDEKSIQIPLMGNIFSSAEVVYIWLGSGNRMTDSAMDFLKRGGLPFRLGLGLKGEDEIPTGYYLSWRLGWHIYGRLITWRTKPHMDGLRDIFSRSWIGRLWTLQEALLARKPVIMCGLKTLPWRSLVYSLRLIHFFNSKPPVMIFPSEYSDWWRLWAFRSELYRQQNTDDTEAACQQSHEEVSEKELKQHEHFLQRGWRFCVLLSCCASVTLLLSLIVFVQILKLLVDLENSGHFAYVVLLVSILFIPSSAITAITGIYVDKRQRIVPLPSHESIFMQIKMRQATKIEDRYYGVHSLINQNRKSARVPDYTLGLARIYRRLFLELLLWTKSLDILLLTSCNKFTGVPSWVVDWRSTSSHWIFLRYFLTPTFWGRWLRTDAKKYEKFKGATLTSTSIWDTKRSKNHLIVRGKIIGRISWCSELLPEEEHGGDSKRLLQSILNFRLAFDNMNLPQIEETMEQLCCMARKYSPTNPRALKHRKSWCKTMYMSREKSPYWASEQFRASSRGLGTSWFNRARSTWGFHRELSDYIAKNQQVLVRCSGEFSGVGVTCKCVQPEDLIVLISGISMPMILRRRKTEFEVRSPALLGGVMNGEYWKDNQNNDQLEEFILA
jgi:hypothetical protein